MPQLASGNPRYFDQDIVVMKDWIQQNLSPIILNPIQGRISIAVLEYTRLKYERGNHKLPSLLQHFINCYQVKHERLKVLDELELPISRVQEARDCFP